MLISIKKLTKLICVPLAIVFLINNTIFVRSLFSDKITNIPLEQKHTSSYPVHLAPASGYQVPPGQRPGGNAGKPHSKEQTAVPALKEKELQEQLALTRQRKEIETEITSLQQEIENTLAEIRRKETIQADLGPASVYKARLLADIDSLYIDIQDSIRRLQETYRQYEGFIASKGIDDERKDFVIIIPTSNRAAHLQRLLDSLMDEFKLFQYCKNRKIQIVIIDDSSTGDYESTHRHIISMFRGSISPWGGNVSIAYYGREEQQALLRGNQSLGIMINDTAAENTERRGLGGMRNMMKLIAATIIKESPAAAEGRLLFLHIDDDVAFGNPLIKTDTDVSSDLLRSHLFNYFARAERIFRTHPEKQVVGGSYTVRDGRLENYHAESLIFYGDTESMAAAGFQPGHYLCTPAFEISAAPLPAVNCRGIARILPLLTPIDLEHGLALAHLQSANRDLGADISDRFRLDVLLAFLDILAPYFLEDKAKKGETQRKQGWDNLQHVLETSKLYTEADIELLSAEILADPRLARTLTTLAEAFSPKAISDRTNKELLCYAQELKLSLRAISLTRQRARMTEKPKLTPAIMIEQVNTYLDQWSLELQTLSTTDKPENKLLQTRNWLQSLISSNEADDPALMTELYLALDAIVSHKGKFLSKWIEETLTVWIATLREMDNSLFFWKQWLDKVISQTAVISAELPGERETASSV